MRSDKEKEVQEWESERALGVLGLPALSECKQASDAEDSDDSTETVSYSPPKSVIRRSESLQLPTVKRREKTLRRTASLPPPKHQGVKVDRLGTIPLSQIGGGIVKKGGVKRPRLGSGLRGSCRGRDSCDC